MKMQPFSLLSGRSHIDPDRQFCNESTVTGCKEDYCECTHVVNIPLKSVVELVLVDEGNSNCNFMYKNIILNDCFIFRIYLRC